MSYILTIPKPCSEHWHQMTPTQKGAFCKSCAKEVIDFTRTSKRELSKKIKREENICGRFKAEQLNTPLPTVSQSQFRRNATILGFTSLLALATPLAAQQTAESMPKVEENYVLGRIAPQPVIPPRTNTITLNGVITDGKFPLPGASVFVKGTRIGVQADFDGNFDLSLSDFYKDSNVTLVISYLGYVTVEKEVNLHSKTINIALTEMEEAVLGGLVVVKRQNIFRSIGGLFRKK